MVVQPADEGRTNQPGDRRLTEPSQRELQSNDPRQPRRLGQRRDVPQVAGVVAELGCRYHCSGNIGSFGVVACG